AVAGRGVEPIGNGLPGGGVERARGGAKGVTQNFNGKTRVVGEEDLSRVAIDGDGGIEHHRLIDVVIEKEPADLRFVEGSVVNGKLIEFAVKVIVPWRRVADVDFVEGVGKGLCQGRHEAGILVHAKVGPIVRHRVHVPLVVDAVGNARVEDVRPAPEVKVVVCCTAEGNYRSGGACVGVDVSVVDAETGEVFELT